MPLKARKVFEFRNNQSIAMFKLVILFLFLIAVEGAKRYQV